MPDLWFDVDINALSAPVNIFPLTDDTDFKTREEAVTYNQAGMDLLWNFVSTDGTNAQTAVTPAVSGNHAWANMGNGMYAINIPASGSAAVNNNLEGFGWFTGYATGILPWRGPVIGFRAAGLNNVLIDSAYSATRGLAGTALPDAAADAAGGLPISDAGGLDLDVQIGTDIDAILTDTADMQPRVVAIEADTNELQTDDYPTSLAAIKAETALIVADTNELQSDWANAGRLDAILDAIQADTGEIGVAGAGLSAVPWNAAWDAEVQSECADALTAYDPPTKAELDTAVANVSVDEIQASALADLFNTDSGDTYAAAAVGSVVKEIADNAGGSALTVQAIRQEMDANSTQLAAIVADTNEVQSDWTNGGRLDLIIDDILGDTNELQSDWANTGRLDLILDAILADTVQIGAAGAGLTAVPWNAAWAANVNAEVVDALNVDTYAEPGQGAPAATASLVAKIGYLYKMWRNKKTQDATTFELYNDAGAVVDQKATVSDDGTDYTHGEIATGP